MCNFFATTCMAYALLKLYDNSKMHNYHSHACIRIVIDAIDEHFCLEENTTMESLKKICA